MAIFYLPPAGIGDFDESATKAAALKQAWHDYIGGVFGSLDGGLFYDAANDPAPGVAVVTKAITWNGFPQSIWRWFNANAAIGGPAQAIACAEVMRPFTIVVRNGRRRTLTWTPTAPSLRKVVNNALGDAVVPFHRQQDEYCEWHAHRNGASKITRIVFTSEGPEYWQIIADTDPDLLVKLYRRYVDPLVEKVDLYWPTDVLAFNPGTNSYDAKVFLKGRYNPYNRWNTTNGCVHLTHPSNTLGAEIQLARDGTVLRPSVTATPAATLPDRLMCCAGYGGVNRSSDPRIGADVNALARVDLTVTLANPVGLYISTIGIGGLADPAGVPIPQALKVVRVSADGKRILRAEITPPPGATYTLDQCTFNGEPLTAGGQIAQQITMTLFGEAKAVPGRTGITEACGAKCCTHPSKAEFETLIGVGNACAGLTAADWAAEGPVAPGDPMPSAAMLTAAPPAAAAFNAAAPELPPTRKRNEL